MVQSRHEPVHQAGGLALQRRLLGPQLPAPEGCRHFLDASEITTTHSLLLIILAGRCC